MDVEPGYRLPVLLRSIGVNGRIIGFNIDLSSTTVSMDF